MKRLAALLLFVSLTPLPSQARSIDDCEKINNPMLYNQCLAEFSPPARRTGPSSASQPGNVAPAYDPPPRGARYRRPEPAEEQIGGSVVQRTKGGRKVATFDIITSDKPRRRRR